MLQWLATMSENDGVPSWLEPLKPEQLDQARTAREPDDTIYAVGVHGALVELEKWVLTAGLAMVQRFFPASLRYEDKRVRDNVHKKFWQRAYHIQSIRKRAGERRRAEEKTIVISAKV